MLDLLLSKQKETGQGDEEFAKSLEISRQHWYRLRNGKAGVTEKIAVRAARKFPDLAPKVLAKMGLSDENGN